MKKIIFIISLIELISCINFILKAGVKSEGYCEREDLIFLFQHSYFVNGIAPNFKTEFSLLMEDDYEANCQIDKSHFKSFDFEILCRINNYLGCIERNIEFPKKIKKEPNSIMLGGDDILIFEGFSNRQDLSLNNEEELINAKIIDEEKTLSYKGFAFKETKTIYGQSIINKYIEGDYFYFLLNNSNFINDLSNYKPFEIKFKEKNEDKVLDNELSAVCHFEKSYINCSCKKENLLNDDNSDIIITKNPVPYELIYFYNFSEQNNIVNEIKVGNLFKSKIDNDQCKYYFNFDIKSLNLQNIEEDILFNFNMSFNNEQVTANCILLTKGKNYFDQILFENQNVDLECYFLLNENLCKRTDLIEYDLYIGSNINNKMQFINNPGKINLVGFDDKETITIEGKNIINKYLENNKINFIIACNKINISYNFKFNLNFTNNENNIYNASCLFNIESQNIKCEDIDNKLTIYDDIIIQSTPEYIILNNKTIYFLNFNGKRTFTIKAGIIEKLPCNELNYYKFNLINSSSKGGKRFFYEIPILINDDQGSYAPCTIEDSNEYNMSCVIFSINCPRNIILDNKEIIIEEYIFYPNTTFFYEFTGKRTITIKPGRIRKGQCDSNNSKYTFTIIQNDFDYKTNSIIYFNLNISIHSIEYISNCSIDLSSKNNEINCQMNTCPKVEDDLIIKTNPQQDYQTLYLNSTYFEDFINKKTTTIKMSKSGMKIKQSN